MASRSAPDATPAATASARRREWAMAVWVTSRTFGPGEAMAAMCIAAMVSRVEVGDTGKVDSAGALR